MSRTSKTRCRGSGRQNGPPGYDGRASLGDSTNVNRIRSIVTQALAAIVLIIGAGAPAAADAGNVEKREFVCMMQDTVMLKPGIPIEHEGRTYYGCCANCSKTIKAEPERFTKAQDPVTGATVDKATAFIYGVGGLAFYFGTQGSRKEFSSDPARYVRIE